MNNHMPQQFSQEKRRPAHLQALQGLKRILAVGALITVPLNLHSCAPPPPHTTPEPPSHTIPVPPHLTPPTPENPPPSTPQQIHESGKHLPQGQPITSIAEQTDEIPQPTVQEILTFLKEQGGCEECLQHYQDFVRNYMAENYGAPSRQPSQDELHKIDEEFIKQIKKDIETALKKGETDPTLWTLGRVLPGSPLSKAFYETQIPEGDRETIESVVRNVLGLNMNAELEVINIYKNTKGELTIEYNIKGKNESITVHLKNLYPDDPLVTARISSPGRGEKTVLIYNGEGGIQTPISIILERLDTTNVQQEANG